MPTLRTLDAQTVEEARQAKLAAIAKSAKATADGRAKAKEARQAPPVTVDDEEARRCAVEEANEALYKARRVDNLHRYLADGDEWEPRRPPTGASMTPAEAEEAAAKVRRRHVGEVLNSMSITREDLCEVLGVDDATLTHYTEHGAGGDPSDGAVKWRRLLKLTQEGELPTGVAVHR